MDEARWARWIPDLRCAISNPASGKAKADLYDAGMERRIPLCNHPLKPNGIRSGNSKFSGMERNRRTLGSSFGGDEEVRLERNDSSRWSALHWQAPTSSNSFRRISRSGYRSQSTRRETQATPL